MANLPYVGNLQLPSIVVSENKPLDVRLVVNAVEDLTNGTIPNLYTGIVVNVKGTGDLYILTSNARGASNINNWKKVGGGSGEINPEDYLSYYQEKLGAVILDSVSGLSSIESPFIGQFAYVKDDPNSSEDESALYVYNGNNWVPISTGGSSTDMSTIITTDGTMPTSGNGISVSTEEDGSFVEEIYADDYLHSGVYYTSRGINSSKDNGGNELEGIDYITLSNGDSWIRFDNKSTITIYIRDDSLGFNMENIVGIIDSNGTEIKNPYAGYPYTESPISISLNGKTYIKFNKDIYFTGLTETRDDGSEEYIFGQTGSNYEDLDFYTTNILPTVYAYSNGEAVRVLTEGDKEELLNKIDEAEPETISNEDIMDLF